MKALGNWNGRAVDYQRKWATFLRVMVEEYERMLAKSAGTTMQQEGHEMEFHAKEALRNGESLTYTIVKYAERTSLAEFKVSELEGLRVMIEMGRNIAQTPPGYMPQQQMQVAYFTPVPPEFQAPMPPMTIAFQIQHQQGSA